MATARLALVKKTLKVYRVAFSDLNAADGVAVELKGAANKLIQLRHIQISKPAEAEIPLTLEKLSSACTGGSSTTPTPVPSRATSAAASGAVKLYTSTPTKGTLINQIWEIDVATTDILDEDFLRDGVSHWILEAAAQSFVLVAAVASTPGVINGFIEWSEEP